MTSLSPLNGSPTGSPRSSHVSNQNVSNVDNVAKERLSLPPSSTTAPLISAEQTGDPFLEKYQEACRFFNHNKEDARPSFLELIEALQKTETDLLFLADCQLQLVLTYPEGHCDRNQSIIDAKQTLGRVYKTRNTWDSLNEEKKINRYKHLRRCLVQLACITPGVMTPNNIASQIEECTRHIPLLTDFYDKMDEGVQNRSAEIFIQALEMIAEHKEPNYLLARAYGTLQHALICNVKEDRTRLALEAQAQTFAAYEAKDVLLVNDIAKLKTLNLFCKLFAKLSQLFPADFDISEKLSECQKEALLLDSALEDTEVSPTNSPRVTKEPVNSWKTARLIIAFGFAAIVIAGAFVLGRRYVSLSK
jgi:hypothetical protein